MTRLVQETQGQRPTGIGNQQVFQEDTSYMNSYARAADSLINNLDHAHTAIAIGKTNDIVQGAMEEVDTTAREWEEMNMQGEAAAGNVERKVNSLSRGVGQGKMTQEKARMLASYEVVKGIENNPMFADKIRQAASSMLGFNPQSEAVRQFFSVFETEAEANRKGALSQYQKEVDYYTNVFGNQDAAVHFVNEQAKLKGEREMLEAEASINKNKVDTFLGETAQLDERATTFRIYSEALKAKAEGQELNKDTWNALAQADMNWYMDQAMASAQRAGLTIPESIRADWEKSTIARYDRLSKSLENLDQDYLNERELERMVTMNKLYGHQAFPQTMFLYDSFGGQVTTRLIDFLISVGNNPDRERALKKVNPALKPFVEMMDKTPEKFMETVTGVMGRLADPSAKLEEGDGKVVDLIASEVMKNATPEETNKFVGQLASSGAEIKASSIALSRGFDTADAGTRKHVKNTWEALQQTVPAKINQLIEEGNGTLTDRGAVLKINAAGTLSLYQGRNQDGSARQATGHPAWPEVQKLNMYLNSTDKGWGAELGITDRKAKAFELMSIAHPASANRIVQEQETKGLQTLFNNMEEERKERLRQEAQRRKAAGGK